jgi:Queuosine biosynthesis protein QueC
LRSRSYRFQVAYADALGSEQAVLRHGKDFYLNFDAVGRYFLEGLSPLLADLLRIGMAVFVVDRRVRREQAPGRSWSRAIQLKVELLRPDFRGSGELLDALEEATEFVTGDDLEFVFEKDRTNYAWTGQLLCRSATEEPPLVCLYSGGLDSAAGLGARLRERPNRLIIPVTAHHQPGQRDRIGTQFSRVRRHFSACIEPLVVRASVSRSGAGKPEPSGRGRSVLFGALGGVAATLAGAHEIEVFESGVGAINIPLMAGMTGSKSTRGCHPEFLRRMSRLVSLVAGRDINFRLPFQRWTKGEMVRAINDAGLADLARDSVSCARYPLGHQCYQQCGICPACIFRRQAMIVGGVEEPQGNYSFDLFGTAEVANALTSKKLNFLNAFLIQVANWGDIENSGQRPEPVYRYLLETQILSSSESPVAIIDLLVRNRDEWRAIAAERRRCGFRWARLLDPAREPVRQGVSHASA